MKKNRKKILLFTIILIVFAVSGCSSVNDPLITDSTNFSEIFDNEGFFSSVFVFPLAKIINFMTGILGVGGGVAVVTLAFNLILLAFTFKSNEQQQVMQSLQPEINKIQKKYEGKTDNNSKMRMVQEQQSLLKKHGISNPLAPMLGAFVQMFAVFIIFPAVRRAESVAIGTFMGMELALTPLQGVQAGNYGYIVLFAVMIAIQFCSMKLPMYLAEQDAKKEAERNHKKYVKVKNPQANMTYFMLVFISVISINWASAMLIYWVCSSAVMVLKTFLTRYISKKRKGEQ